jgi:hypothetical protein
MTIDGFVPLEYSPRQLVAFIPDHTFSKDEKENMNPNRVKVHDITSQ